MAEKLTPQQQLAVDNRGGKLLVSAAAGSGKTKVLVDRLMKYVLDDATPSNLDDFLIITFTEAAASELRGKIASKLSEHMANDPGNRHIQRQMQRLFLTKISTVHSFCTDIIREYAYRLDVAGDFRVGDENECAQLRSAAMEETLEAIYSQLDQLPEVQAFIDTQSAGRNDALIPEIVLDLYESSRCHLDPDGWLADCQIQADVSAVTDAAQTVWGLALVEDLKKYLNMQILAMEHCARAVEQLPGLEKAATLLWENVDQLTNLYNCTTWDEIVDHKELDFGRLTFSKKFDVPEITEHIKVVRDACKDSLKNKLVRFSDYSSEILADQQSCAKASKGLIYTAKQFSEAYNRLKKKRRILDFSDLEQYALELLLGKNRSNPTAAADEIGSRFREIMVDEYQDTNAVQDAIFSVLTRKRNNLFMVGDVKQSIYQFRLADPGIFLEKYESFDYAGRCAPGEGRKVMLSHNFRSSGGVIEAVNHVFSCCMSTDVGGLDYGEDEKLNEGIPHIPLGDCEVELHGIITQNNAYEEEAAFTADRIQQMLDGKHYIRDGENLRPITESDIVILLRSPGTTGSYFLSALEERGIPCSAGGSTDLLTTAEIEVLINLLKIISNPRQDIPLVGVLASPVGCFGADDLAALRCVKRNVCLYDALCASNEPKCIQFLQMLKSLREYAAFALLPDLLQQIYRITSMEYIFSDPLAKSNLFAFYQYAVGYSSVNNRDLDQFLRHLELLEKRGLPVDKQAPFGCVNVMSIHKSKGLEFPVVFLCGLAKEFNRMDLNAQMLCHKELYLGLSCIDTQHRVRYPSLAKHAIAVRKLSESLSEELRILYVAMTRARDRLIMTYADKYLLNTLKRLASKLIYSSNQLICSDVKDAGEWVLFSALKRAESNDFFSVVGNTGKTSVSEFPWLVTLQQSEVLEEDEVDLGDTIREASSPVSIDEYKDAISFQYAYYAATKAPSKQTATQRKGRVKDREAEQDAPEQKQFTRHWRGATQRELNTAGKEYGNAMHNVLRFIRYSQCGCVESIREEINRLGQESFISPEHAALADADALARFFATDVGKKIMNSANVLREYKFSVLEDGENYAPELAGEKILLQGVVDCALIENDGITVIDFKTDAVTDETVSERLRDYVSQVETYAQALSRIFELPIKAKALYFFRLSKFFWI